MIVLAIVFAKNMIVVAILHPIFLAMQKRKNNMEKKLAETVVYLIYL